MARGRIQMRMEDTRSVAGWLVALLTLMLSGFGVYLGRVERWNSWNFWQTPRALARSLIEPLQNPSLAATA